MTFIDNDDTDASFNLALEECLFEQAQSSGEGFVSLWRNSPSVVVGRYQNTVDEVNQSFVKNNGVKVVRRITGGGAVYHDLGNLNYTIIKKCGENFDCSDFVKIITEGLALLGVDAFFSGRNDILVGDKKISGHAQHISKNTVLHHGTLLFDSNLESLTEALNVSSEKLFSKAIQSVRERVTNIKPILPREFAHFDVARFRASLKKFLTKKFDITEIRPPNENEIERAHTLTREKYSKWDWNW